jgi:hypothetical protein
VYFLTVLGLLLASVLYMTILLYVTLPIIFYFSEVIFIYMPSNMYMI